MEQYIINSNTNPKTTSTTSRSFTVKERVQNYWKSFKEMLDNGKNYLLPQRIELNQNLLKEDKIQRINERKIIINYLDKMNSDKNFQLKKKKLVSKI